MTQLKDLMNTSVVTVAPETTVSQAAAGMVRARVGSVVVMQGSFLAGILTERDVLRAAGSGEDLTASLVTAWMSADPQAASLDTTAEEGAPEEGQTQEIRAEGNHSGESPTEASPTASGADPVS